MLAWVGRARMVVRQAGPTRLTPTAAWVMFHTPKPARMMAIRISIAVAAVIKGVLPAILTRKDFHCETNS